MALVVGFAAVTMAQTPAQGEDVEAGVGGDVTLTAADGTTVPASGVRLILHCAAEPSERLEISDEAGAFRFERVPAAGCAISTNLQGFRSETAAIETARTADLRFRLEVDPVFASVTVTGGGLAHGRHDAVRIRRLCLITLGTLGNITRVWTR